MFLLFSFDLIFLPLKNADFRQKLGPKASSLTLQPPVRQGPHWSFSPLINNKENHGVILTMVAAVRVLEMKSSWGRAGGK